MTERSKNCWEYMNCGREEGGANAATRGVCPAATAAALNGVHHGTNAGRACWVIAGTFCKGGQPQGTFATKYRDCGHCHFFEAVRREEVALVPTYFLTGLCENGQAPAAPAPESVVTPGADSEGDA